MHGSEPRRDGGSHSYYLVRAMWFPASFQEGLGTGQGGEERRGAGVWCSYDR